MSDQLLFLKTHRAHQSRPARPSLPPPDERPTDHAASVESGQPGPHDQLPVASIVALVQQVGDWDTRSPTQRTQTVRGTEALLAFLADLPGLGWQDKWHASGLDQDFTILQTVDTSRWTTKPKPSRALVLAGVSALILADVIRPSFKFFRDYSPQSLYRRVREVCWPEQFARVEEKAAQLHVPPPQRAIALSVLCILCLHTGRAPDRLTPEDFFAIYRSHRSRSENKPPGGVSVAWDLSRGSAQIPDVPFAIAKAGGQRSTAELVDSYPIACREIRNLIVRYLDERRAGLDYGSFENLARTLARFWVDIEAIQPGITTLHLPDSTARAWKESVRTVTNADGTTRPRLDRLGIFVPVRAFYLDIAQWALHEPSWAAWAVPCPLSRADTDGYAKNKQRVTARMHQRVRERLPKLQDLADAADDRRQHLTALHEVALDTPAGDTFNHAGHSYRRVEKLGRNEPPTGAVRRSRHPVMIIEDTATGAKVDLTRAEDEAFWCWAVIETLRHTGVRVEELTEITQLGLINYRTPDTGESIPLLQIVPSKSNQERVLLVSPELASVLATIIARHRADNGGTVPWTRRVDRYERATSEALPYLFQRRRTHRYNPITPGSVNALLRQAIAHAGITDAAGDPLHMTAHDFRRMFATEAVTGGLPVHIAARLLGHANITTTQSYLAVFNDDLIRAYRRHLDRRRAERPAEEYREPTPDEWTAFEQHFAARKLELGTCGRPYGTPCKHEHACIRCPMLRVDPRARPRLQTIIANLTERIEEARTNGWRGEIEGLKTSRAAATQKLTDLDRTTHRTSQTPVDLGIPTVDT